jgi:hypothetical protein
MIRRSLLCPSGKAVNALHGGGITSWARLNCAADAIVYECSGLMFWFTQKKFVGSYLAFRLARRW